MRINDLVRPPQHLVDGFRQIETGTLSDVLDTLNVQGVASGIWPRTSQARIAGPAVTVKQISCTLGTYTDAKDFCLGDVLEFAQSGDILVFDSAGQEISTWGGLASTAAKMKGIAGTIIDGACRDIPDSREIDYPVFSRHVTPRTGKTRLKLLELNSAVQCGGVRVYPGDIVVADPTGIVIVPVALMEKVLEIALEYEEKERHFSEELKKGLTFKEMHQRMGRV
jgi:3-hexulose-6-phosphate synthase / 6-phospho-3-hexuloisomerase